MIEGIITLTGGALAASGIIISKQSNAHDLKAKMDPIQGWLGILLAGWGLWELYNCLQVTQLLSIPMFRNHWIFWIVCSITDVSIGLMLASGLLNSRSGSQNSARFSKIQVPLGIFAIGMGIAFLILYRGY